jgi:hypothetical protein
MFDHICQIGLTLLESPPGTIGILLWFHSIGMTIMEYTLSLENDRYESAVYPFYLVPITSAIGVAVVIRLHAEKRVTNGWLSLYHSAILSICSSL